MAIKGVIPHSSWWAAMCQQVLRGGCAVLAFLLGVGLATPSTAQTADDALRFSERLPGSGARLVGMTGAGIAGVADFGALYTNPAGLGFLQQSQVVGSFNVLAAQDDARYEPAALEGQDPRISTNLQTVTNYGLGNAGLAYKIPTQRGSLVLAGGLNQATTFERTLDYVGESRANSITDTFLPFTGNYQVGSGGSITFDFETPRRAFEAGAIEFIQERSDNGEYPFIQAVAPTTLIQQSDEVIEEGRLTEANFGGAVEAAPGVMAGASLNISFGTYRFSRLYREVDILDENTPDLYEVAVDGGFVRGFDELNMRETITSDLVGVNLRAGLAADLNSAVRAGVVIESPTWYSVSETFGTQVTTFFDEGASLSAGQTGANEFDYSVRSPWRIGGGAQLALGSLRLMGDVEFVDWTQLRLTADGVSFDEATDRIRDFKPVVNSRFGAEYRFDDLIVRGGFAYQPDPRDVEIELSDGETTNRSQTFHSAGFSYRFDTQFRIDFGWSQQRFDDQYRPYASVTVPGENVDIVAPYVDEEITRNRFLLGVSYFF